MNKLITKIIQFAGNQREGFSESIGLSNQCEEAIIRNLPNELKKVYETVRGTIHQIENQKLMDLIPGYRLIHIEELLDEKEEFLKTYPHLEYHFPFLADYSSSYYSINLKTKEVYTCDPVKGGEPMSESLERFFETILHFYETGIYELDEDGFLDYDFEKEGKEGAKMNPNYNYWTV